jgi:ABC-type dipeptide/oligopeptide/nickel transport system permease component
VLSYILKRIFVGLITVFAIATITFFGMHFVPGDPLMKGKVVNPVVRKNLEEKYGLNKPILVQYGTFLINMGKGDFGISFTQQNRSVNEIIREHFPVSAMLGSLAIVIAAFGGIIGGAIAAIKRNQWADRSIMSLVILFVSVPGFVFAAFGQVLIAEIKTRTGVEVLPVAGWGTLAHMILPSLVLGLGTMAFLARLMRSSMLEVVHQDYIRTAKAKGVSPLKIFFRHQLRNAVLPVVTFLGPAVAAITTGGFVAEIVFAIPGLGRYFVQAVQQLDYTVIMGLTVFYGAYLVLVVIFVDVIYGFIDPRIRIAGA